MDEVRYKETEAARIVGVSVDTLRRWRRSGKFEPSDSATFGERTAYLYTEDDIVRLRSLVRTKR